MGGNYVQQIISAQKDDANRKNKSQGGMYIALLPCICNVILWEEIMYNKYYLSTKKAQNNDENR